MSTTSQLLLVAAIVGVGVAAQAIADRLRVPSVLFLLLGGVALGPEVAGVVTLASFDGALPTVVGLSVAVIVFEGAFHLRLDRVRTAPSEAFRLVTVGAAIALVGTAVAVRFALDAAWDISLLVGSLLVATGPTVITPVLNVVPVRDRVAAALETEGVVNDVTAAVLAVVMFELVNAEAAPGELVNAFVRRIGSGMLVGAAVAVVVWYVLSHSDLVPDDAPRNSRLVVLSGAIVAYALGEAVATEAGIAAVAVAGVMLGNVSLPHEEEITAFKGDVTLFVLSFVFVTLAALLSLDDLLALGPGGLAVVAAVTVVVRPLLVWLSTAGGRLTNRERWFMSFVGPRGIIPASVATLFAVQLQNRAAALRDVGLTQQAATLEAQATLLAGTVFLVILVTVVVEGGFARHAAQYLEVIPMRVLIVGGGRVGRSLAERLEDRGENVIVVERDEEMAKRARGEGLTVHVGDGTDTSVLKSAGADRAKIVAAATSDDDTNLFVAQLADSKFDVEKIVARVNDPTNVDPFEDLGVRPIGSGLAVAWAMDNVIERPALSNWMTELGRAGDVQEVEVTAPDVVGRTIKGFGQELPSGVLIALVGRAGDSEVPEPDRVIEEGDHVTLVGRTDAVHEARERCNPRDL